MTKQLIVQIIGSDFNKNVEISKRSYDNKYNLWRRCVKLNEDTTYDIFWEIIGVYANYNDASSAKNKYRREYN